jgi:lipopolysaccharide exporter
MRRTAGVASVEPGAASEEDGPAQSGSPGLAARAAKGAAWSGLSTIVLRFGSILVGVVIARLLTPEQFGVYAVALTVQGILMAVADLGLSANLIRSERPERIAPTVATFGLVSGGTLALATALCAAPLADLMGAREAGGALAVLSLTLLLGGASVVPYGMLMRGFRQRELFIVSLVDFIVSTVVTLVLMVAGFGVMALAIGRVAAQASSSVLQFFLARMLPRYGLDRSELRDVLAFGLPVAGANLLGWVLLNADKAILARLAGPTVLGYYVLASNVASWPMSALSQVVRASILPYVARARSGAEALPMLTGLVGTLALPAGAVLAALSTPIIGVVYGDKWLPAAPALAALGLYGGLRVGFDIFAGYLYAHGRSRPVMWLQLVSLCTLVAGMLVMTPHFGMLGAAWAQVIVSVVIVLPGYLLVLRSSDVSVLALAKACIRPAAATVPAVVVALLSTLLLDSHLLALLVGGAGAVLVYLALTGRWLLRQARAFGKADAQQQEAGDHG